jgi:hypothetical protein
MISREVLVPTHFIGRSVTEKSLTHYRITRRALRDTLWRTRAPFWRQRSRPSRNLTFSVEWWAPKGDWQKMNSKSTVKRRVQRLAVDNCNVVRALCWGCFVLPRIRNTRLDWIALNIGPGVTLTRRVPETQIKMSLESRARPVREHGKFATICRNDCLHNAGSSTSHNPTGLHSLLQR